MIDPYSPTFYHHHGPDDLTLGWLWLTYRVADKRRFPPGLFTPLAENLFEHQLGPPTRGYADDLARGERPDWTSWTMDCGQLLDATVSLLKLSATRRTDRRRKAATYLDWLSELWLIELIDPERPNRRVKLAEGYPERVEIRFTDRVQWMVQKQHELFVNDEGQLTKDKGLLRLKRWLMRAHYFVNARPWARLLPNRRRVPINEGGALTQRPTRAVDARLWAHYARRILAEHLVAFINGGCDYHPKSKRPAQARAVRRKRTLISTHWRDDPEADKAAIKAEVEELVEDITPQRESYRVGSKGRAELLGQSRMTHLRACSHRHITNHTAQASLICKPVPASLIGPIRRMRADAGLPPPRFRPAGNGLYIVEQDEANYITFKSGHSNWEMRDRPLELQDMMGDPIERDRDPKRCQTHRRVRITEHPCKPLPSETIARKAVIAASIVTVVHRPEPRPLRKLLKKHGVALPGTWRRRRKVPARGSHHKDRTIERRRLGPGVPLPFFCGAPVTKGDLERRHNHRTLEARRRRLDAERTKFISDGIQAWRSARFKIRPSGDEFIRKRQQLERQWDRDHDEAQGSGYG